MLGHQFMWGQTLVEEMCRGRHLSVQAWDIAQMCQSVALESVHDFWKHVVFF